MALSRRGFVGGLLGIVAAPAIVRVASIMPVKVMEPVFVLPDYRNYSIVRPIILNPSMYRDLMKLPEYGDDLARGLILEQKQIPVSLGSYQGVKLIGYNGSNRHGRRAEASRGV